MLLSTVIAWVAEFESASVVFSVKENDTATAFSASRKVKCPSSGVPSSSRFIRNVAAGVVTLRKPKFTSFLGPSVPSRFVKEGASGVPIFAVIGWGSAVMPLLSGLPGSLAVAAACPVATFVIKFGAVFRLCWPEQLIWIAGDRAGEFTTSVPPSTDGAGRGRAAYRLFEVSNGSNAVPRVRISVKQVTPANRASFSGPFTAFTPVGFLLAVKLLLRLK